MIRDAIILAGGLGTRMLPASLYSPKEALPLIDTPILNHLIWEVTKARISRIHLVLSRDKYRFFEKFLSETNNNLQVARADLPREALSMGSDGVEIIPHIQENPGGVGDAISVALGSIEGCFLVVLGDMVLIEKHHGPMQSGPYFASSASERLISRFEESGRPCVGVVPVDLEEVKNYGVAEVANNLVMNIEEKPTPAEAKSNLILCGRYIFPKETRDLLLKFPVSKHGELQSILILNYLIKNGGLGAVNLEGMEMYDSGDPMSWLKSQIDHGLRRDDTYSELSEWLTNRLSRI